MAFVERLPSDEVLALAGPSSVIHDVIDNVGYQIISGILRHEFHHIRRYAAGIQSVLTIK